jgi:hypothetical protein
MAKPSVRPKKKVTMKRPLKRRVRRRAADDFIAVARRIGTDEDKATFEAKLGKIAKAKPPSSAKG